MGQPLIKNHGDFAIFKVDSTKPKNKGQAALLDYFNEVFESKKSIDNDKIKKLYIKHVKAGTQNIKYNYSDDFYSHSQCIEAGYDTGTYWYTSKDFGPIWKAGNFVPWTIEDYDVQTGASSWLNRSIGSLVRNGYLMIIPAGYKLIQIENG